MVAAVVYGLRSRVLIQSYEGRLANLKKGADMEAEKNVAIWDEMRKLRNEIDVSRQGINRRDKINSMEWDGDYRGMDEQVKELAEDTARMRDILGRMEVGRTFLNAGMMRISNCLAVITKAYGMCGG